MQLYGIDSTARRNTSKTLDEPRESIILEFGRDPQAFEIRWDAQVESRRVKFVNLCFEHYYECK